jgi:hypothetical protein
MRGPAACRLTALSLSPSGVGGGSARGSEAAEGITNPGRLLGLGLALGIGPEIFGAPGPTDGPGQLAADLLPLSPQLSKSQLRKLQRRAMRSDGLGLRAAAAEAAAAEEAAPSSKGGRQQPGRRSGKLGKSRSERRSSQGGGSAADSLAAAVAAGGSGLGLGGSGGSQQAQQQVQQLVSGDYGDFERHTTGIGSKLLSKWGFAGEGSGLGPKQQGRSEPVQAVRRAKGLGLGAERP